MIDIKEKQKDAEYIIEQVKQDIEKGKVFDLFVITFDASKSPSTYYSGNWMFLALVSQIASADFNKYYSNEM